MFVPYLADLGMFKVNTIGSVSQRSNIEMIKFDLFERRAHSILLVY